MTRVGITGFGTYTPPGRITGPEIAERSGIPEAVVVEKMGVVEKPVCPPDDDHISDMCVAAATDALGMAGLEPTDIDLVLYHGSEYKDYVVWSVAAEVAHRLGATNAYATESHTLCASTPIAVRGTRALLRSDDVDRALHVTASREEDLIDYTNQDSSFMFNFGSGAAAYVLEADPGERTRATVHESAALTDGSFSRDVVMPAGGSRRPPSPESVAEGAHTLDVPDPDGMKERLGPVSLPNFVEVTERALDRSGLGIDDLSFVALTHMKRSFHHDLLEALGLSPSTDGVYLDHYGHVQSADQFIALEEALERNLLVPGDIVGFVAAGTGYTWAATALTWRG
ncbi:MAG: 3-oxoacyl-ACP synthase [Halobacteriales archaeon]